MGGGGAGVGTGAVAGGGAVEGNAVGGAVVVAAAVVRRARGAGGATITEVGLAAIFTAVVAEDSAAVVGVAAAVPWPDPWGAPGWDRGPVRLVTPAPA